MAEDWRDVGEVYRLRTDSIELTVTELAGGRLDIDLAPRTPDVVLREPQVVTAGRGGFVVAVGADGIGELEAI